MACANRLLKMDIRIIAFILLFTYYQSVPEVEPTTIKTTGTTNARIATHVQTITTIERTVMLVTCKVDTLHSGEIIQICMPALWNGELILYAHSYVAEFELLRLPEETVAYLPLYTSLRIALATTSFRQNGLAIQSGLEDIINLRTLFIRQH